MAFDHAIVAIGTMLRWICVDLIQECSSSAFKCFAMGHTLVQGPIDEMDYGLSQGKSASHSPRDDYVGMTWDICRDAKWVCANQHFELASLMGLPSCVGIVGIFLNMREFFASGFRGLIHLIILTWWWWRSPNLSTNSNHQSETSTFWRRTNTSLRYSTRHVTHVT